MSLYELESMLDAFVNMGRTESLTKEEMEETMNRLREYTKDDPSVRI